MKSRVAPNMQLYQIVVQDFSQRHPVSDKEFYVDKSGKGIREVVDFVPLRTLFRYAKRPKQAQDWAKKFGSVKECHKVDSYLHRLEMISHLNVEMKPISIDISVEEFTVGKDLEITPKIESKNIIAGSEIAIDKDE